MNIVVVDYLYRENVSGYKVVVRVPLGLGVLEKISAGRGELDEG